MGALGDLAQREAREYARANASDLTDEGVGALARGFHDGYLAVLGALGSPEVVRGIAEVLAEHGSYYGGCKCGWQASGPVARTVDDLRAHQAAAIASWLTREGAS